MANTKIDLSTLEWDQQRRIDRVLHPRDTLFSRKFCPSDVMRWKQTAGSCGMTLQQWVEWNLRAAAQRGMKLLVPPTNTRPRTKMLSLRFTRDDVETWARQATLTVSTTDWVEHALTVASLSARSLL